MENNMKVAKIHDRYVGENCAQLMIPYFTTMTVFNNSEMLFHADEINNIVLNSYLHDERREQFPYHDIPIHYTKKLFQKKMVYVNQIYDFNKPYILIRSGVPQQYYVSKTNDGAIVIQQNLELANHNRMFFNTEEMHSFLRELLSCKNGEQSFAMEADGRFLNFVSKEERMIELNKFLDYLEENNIYYKYDGYNLYFSDITDKSKIPNTMIPTDGSIFIVKINGSEIKIKLVNITSMDKDYSRLSLYDLPINKYTLEQILCLTSEVSKTLKEPSISRRLNKNIAKSMILTSKK